MALANCWILTRYPSGNIRPQVLRRDQLAKDRLWWSTRDEAVAAGLSELADEVRVTEKTIAQYITRRANLERQRMVLAAYAKRRNRLPRLIERPPKPRRNRPARLAPPTVAYQVPDHLHIRDNLKDLDDAVTLLNSLLSRDGVAYTVTATQMGEGRYESANGRVVLFVDQLCAGKWLVETAGERGRTHLATALSTEEAASRIARLLRWDT